MGSENARLRLTGAEIRRTFGTTDVEDLEREQQAVLVRLNEIYNALRSGEDAERIEELKAEADDLRLKMREVNRMIRQEQNKVSDILTGKGTREKEDAYTEE